MQAEERNQFMVIFGRTLKRKVDGIKVQWRTKGDWEATCTITLPRGISVIDLDKENTSNNAIYLNQTTKSVVLGQSYFSISVVNIPQNNHNTIDLIIRVHWYNPGCKKYVDPQIEEFAQKIYQWEYHVKTAQESFPKEFFT